MSAIQRFLNPIAIEMALDNSNNNLKWPIKHQEAEARIPSILLFGPPNTGKTSQLRAFPDAVYYGTDNSSAPIAAMGIKLPVIEDWNSQKWLTVGDKPSYQGYHIRKDGGVGTQMPFLSFPRLARAFPAYAGRTVVLDEYTNWEAAHKARCITGAFYTDKGAPDTGAEWAKLGDDQTLMRSAAIAAGVPLIAVGHVQKAEQKEFRGKLSQAMEGIKTSSYKQGAQFATLFGMRVHCTQGSGRMVFKSDPFQKNSVMVDRTGIIRGECPANLGMVLRGGGYALSRTHTRFLEGGATTVVEGAPLDEIVLLGIRNGIERMKRGLTEENVGGIYAEVDRYVIGMLRAGAAAGHFPSDVSLFRWVREDVRDALEIMVLYYEAEGAL